ncbi:MAG: hypothetical protein U0736_19120 [Gemmataceae bacterium]
MAAPLLRAAMAELDGLVTSVNALGSLRGVVLTHAAAGLPGLLPSLRARVQMYARAGVGYDSGDYGEHLFRAAGRADDRVQVLPIDAVARMAHELAVRTHRGDFPHGHLDTVPVPPAAGDVDPDRGPPRLCYRGHDHPLCHSPVHPPGHVHRVRSCSRASCTRTSPAGTAAIVQDRRGYILHDHSRHPGMSADRKGVPGGRRLDSARPARSGAAVPGAPRRAGGDTPAAAARRPAAGEKRRSACASGTRSPPSSACR